MSEFFKALEQAERDRAREELGEAASAPIARTISRETPSPERVDTTAKAAASGTRAAVARPPAVEPAVKPPPPKPVVARPPVAKPAAPAPNAAKSVLERPAPPLPTAAARRGGVFRPSLRGATPARRPGRFGQRAPLLITQTDPASAEANAYRTVRANIELMSENGPFRRIAVTSAAGGDGKSTTAANLAVVAAQGGRRVCLVDADLRRPSLNDVFGLANVGGLATALESGKSLEAVAQPTDIENLSVVVAGRGAHETFQDLVTPQRLGVVLRELETKFDLVIFDTPPVLSVADALNVAAVCDGVILVVRAGSIPFSVLRRTITQVNQVNGRILGVLLNQADLRTTDPGSYRYYRTNEHNERRP